MLAMSLLRWAPKCEWLCPTFFFLLFARFFLFFFFFHASFFLVPVGVSWYAPDELCTA